MRAKFRCVVELHWHLGLLGLAQPFVIFSCFANFASHSGASEEVPPSLRLLDLTPN